MGAEQRTTFAGLAKLMGTAVKQCDCLCAIENVIANRHPAALNDDTVQRRTAQHF